MSLFSVVATPIGNLGDITLRALETLRAADIVLCEDTRVTKKLFDRHNIVTKAVAYHSHSKISKVDFILDALRAGKNIALVSDAGTPGISDPGTELVRKIREDMSAELVSGDLKIEAIPGPSALAAAISIAGVPTAEFTFLGFLPHKKGRQTIFKEIFSSERTFIFYESPHRILKTMESLRDMRNESPIGDAVPFKKKITICRELTKVFEEVISGFPEEVLEFLTKNAEKVRGEFVVIVSTVK